MSLGKVVRHSPIYLYFKLYSLSFLVTLFSSTPVTRHLSREHIQRIEQIRQVADDILGRRVEDDATHSLPTTATTLQKGQYTKEEKEVAIQRFQELKRQQHQDQSKEQKIARHLLCSKKRRTSTSLAFPFALKTLALDADTRFSSLPLKGGGALYEIARIVRRWARRFNDLNSVQSLVLSDQTNIKRSPELLSKANVRLVANC